MKYFAQNDEFVNNDEQTFTDNVHCSDGLR